MNLKRKNQAFLKAHFQKNQRIIELRWNYSVAVIWLLLLSTSLKALPETPVYRSFLLNVIQIIYY